VGWNHTNVGQKSSPLCPKNIIVKEEIQKINGALGINTFESHETIKYHMENFLHLKHL
jgi:hypothetical protein